MNVIRSHHHEVFTEQVNKIVLSADDDKRMILPDQIHTLSHGFQWWRQTERPKGRQRGPGKDTGPWGGEFLCYFWEDGGTLGKTRALGVGEFLYNFEHRWEVDKINKQKELDPSIPSSYLLNYFAEIASVHIYQTRLASLQKDYLPRMKTSLCQLSLKYIGPIIWSNIPEKLKSSSPYSFGKKYKKVLLSCQTSCWSSFYMLVTFCNIALMPLFSLLSTSIVAHPTPCT